MIAQMKTTLSSILYERTKKINWTKFEKTRNKGLYALIGMTQTQFSFMVHGGQPQIFNCLNSSYFHAIQSGQRYKNKGR